MVHMCDKLIVEKRVKFFQRLKVSKEESKSNKTRFRLKKVTTDKWNRVVFKVEKGSEEENCEEKETFVVKMSLKVK